MYQSCQKDYGKGYIHVDVPDEPTAMGGSKPRPEATEKHNQLVTDSLAWAQIATDILMPIPLSLTQQAITESRNLLGESFFDFNWTKDIYGQICRVDHNQVEKLLTEKISNPQTLRQLQTDLAKFESRAKEDHLAPEEVTRTYRQVARLLTSKDDTIIDENLRVLLAAQIIHQAAQPFDLNQGQHNTCGPSALSVRLYARNPASAARVIADIATSKDGEFKTLSGMTVTITKDSLRPDSEASEQPLPDGKRSYANQILQLALVNAHWAGHDDYNKEGRQYQAPITYQQLHNVTKDDSGERLIDGTGQTIDDGPNIPHTEMTKLYREFSQEGSVPFLVVDKGMTQLSPKQENAYTEASVASSGELLRTIQQQQKSNMPLLVLVDPYQPPWSKAYDTTTTTDHYTTNGQAYGLADEPEPQMDGLYQTTERSSKGKPLQVPDQLQPNISPAVKILPPHMVNITDCYQDQATGQWIVSISNQWGTASDISIDLDLLYKTLARRKR
ncbi:MAG: hypothetical protein HY711_11365 [Candidatus Melainabacteria bacterium]|nr:hypothetical protein [Candidatus Melainabacteria bacterium]